MKKNRLFLMACLSIALNAEGSHLSDKILLTAKLEGAQEVPAVATNAVGVASVFLNSMRDSACINASFTGLSGPVTGMHIHDGLPGVNGPVLIDLTPFVSGNRMTMLLTGLDLTDSTLAQLLSGQYYINIHTAANPNGEIRGQLTVESDWSFSVMMDGNQEIPPVPTTAYGVGFFNLSHDSSAISYMVVTQGLSGAMNAAHLHGAPLGSNGGIVVDLTGGISGNIVSGTIANPTDTLLDSLFAGDIYINVHTDSFPGGEIRSQLMHNNGYLYFDAMLNGSQEVPAVITDGQGVMTAWMNGAMDTLWFDVAADSLSGPITTAHFHHAPAGVSGGVEIDLTNFISGNRLTGFVTGMLTDSVINKFLAGEIYINLHTALNPGGEIRGQVYRLMREGYVFTMNGAQEVPPVITSATGSGIVTVNRDQNNAHFMFTADGLTPTASHFHINVAGQAGGVAFDLMPYMSDNGWFGHWTSTSSPPFTPTSSLQFRSDSMYVNVHTVANPSGEIRGQVVRNFSCDVVVGLPESENDLSFNIYPNPVENYLYISFSEGFSDQVNLVIYDVTGRSIYEQKIAAHELSDLRISTAAFEAGLYMITIDSNNRQTNQVFVKN